MIFVRAKRITKVAALFVVLLFAGDLVADSVLDAVHGHCMSQASGSTPNHEKEPCSHCSCAAHAGTALVAEASLVVNGVLTANGSVSSNQDASPERLPVSIEHPPQLA
jgi:hypothetical protein